MPLIGLTKALGDRELHDLRVGDGFELVLADELHAGLVVPRAGMILIGGCSDQRMQDDSDTLDMPPCPVHSRSCR